MMTESKSVIVCVEKKGKREIIKEHKEAFEGDGYLHFLIMMISLQV